MRQRLTSRRAPLAALFIGLVVVLGACGNENRQNSLDPKGPAAHKIDNLFTPVLGIAIAIGIGVVLATIVFAIKFRHRPGQPDNPRQIHGSTPLEIGWTILPALILIVIAVPTIATIFDLAKTPAKADRVDVTVTGKQWWWQFEYPKGSVGNDKKEIVTSTELHIPVGKPVYLSLKSADVIHSFWIPELSGKKDVVPSRTNKLTIEATKPGTYLGQCAEYCGLAHADMRMRVIAQTQSDFDAWVRDQLAGPDQPYSGDIVTLTGKTYGCVNCHIFDDSSKTNYGPNLTHLASRSTFAGGTMEVTKKNLRDWIMDAPSLVPMESKDCRLPPPATCEGMPSFTKNTPKGQKTMTREDADAIVDYLYGEK
jgi:cytochrome c oxidase subunit 2